MTYKLIYAKEEKWGEPREHDEFTYITPLLTLISDIRADVQRAAFQFFKEHPNYLDDIDFDNPWQANRFMFLANRVGHDLKNKIEEKLDTDEKGS